MLVLHLSPRVVQLVNRARDHRPNRIRFLHHSRAAGQHPNHLTALRRNLAASRALVHPHVRQGSPVHTHRLSLQRILLPDLLVHQLAFLHDNRALVHLPSLRLNQLQSQPVSLRLNRSPSLHQSLRQSPQTNRVPVHPRSRLLCQVVSHLITHHLNLRFSLLDSHRQDRPLNLHPRQVYCRRCLLLRNLLPILLESRLLSRARSRGELHLLDLLHAPPEALP